MATAKNKNDRQPSGSIPSHLVASYPQPKYLTRDQDAGGDHDDAAEQDEQPLLLVVEVEVHPTGCRTLGKLKTSAPPTYRATGTGDPKRPFRLPQSITSSARVRIDDGTLRPSALAVLRLMTSSNVVGCWTGRSSRLVPLMIFPT